MSPADDAWLPRIERWAGGRARVIGRAPLAGGYAAADAVQRVALEVEGREIAVVVKHASAVEVAAMRALGSVPGLDAPRLLAAGPGWIVSPFYDGAPPVEPAPVPAEIWTALGRVHAHWHRRRPRVIPVVDPVWWRSTIRGSILPAVRGAGERTGEALYREVAVLLEAWTTDPRVRRALAVLPRTLTHGDAHRGNVLVGPATAVLIDWGNARMAPAGLDLAVLAAQGAPAPQAYLVAAGPAAAGGPLREVERQWAWMQAHVQYLGFAADHLGSARVTEMVQTATDALDALGHALGRG